MNATINSKIIIPEYVLFRKLQGGAVILNLDSGMYFEVNESGVRMWHYISEFGHVNQAYQKLLADYEVNQTQLLQDLLQFLNTMINYGLLKLDDAN